MANTIQVLFFKSYCVVLRMGILWMCSKFETFLLNKLFDWNWRATVGLVLDAAATADVEVVVCAAEIAGVFGLLAVGDSVPTVDDWFIVDIALATLLRTQFVQ